MKVRRAVPEDASGIVDVLAVVVAQSFYRRLGFVECGRLSRHVIVDGIHDDEVLLELFL